MAMNDCSCEFGTSSDFPETIKHFIESKGFANSLVYVHVQGKKIK